MGTGNEGFAVQRLLVAVVAVVAGLAFSVALAGLGPSGSNSAADQRFSAGLVTGSACSDSNTFPGDCCSPAGIQEEDPTCPGSRCTDGVDNDGDGLIDTQDPECATLSGLENLAILGLAPSSTQPPSVQIGIRADVKQVLGTGADPSPPYPFGDSKADICANDFRGRFNGTIEGNVMVFGEPFMSGRGGPLIIEGSLFTGGQAAVLPNRIKPFAIPFVGDPAWCTGKEGVQPCTVATQASDCDPGDFCEIPRRVDDPANTFVDLSGALVDGSGNPTLLGRCNTLVTADLPDIVARISPLFDVEENLGDVTLPRNQTQTITVSSPVIRFDILRVGRRSTLTIDATGQPFLFIRVTNRVRVGIAGTVQVLGVATDKILWFLEGPGPNVRIGRGATMAGTVLAVDRDITVAMRGRSEFQGSLVGQHVRLIRDSTVNHVPFTVLLPTDIAVSKSVTIRNPIAGQAVAGFSGLTYTIDVTNHGPSYAPGTRLVDTLPSGLTLGSVTSTLGVCDTSAFPTIECHFGTLPRGHTETVTVEVDIDPDTRGLVNNIATASSHINDPRTGNNSDNAAVIAVGLSDLSVSKSVSSSDGALVIAGQSTLTYTITIDNAGPSDALVNGGTGVVLTDTLPPRTTFVSAVHSGGGSCSEAGGVVTCDLGRIDVTDPPETVTITVTVDPDAHQFATLTNTVSVDPDNGLQTDPDTSNNSASVDVNPVGHVDLVTVKTDSVSTSPGYVVAGETMTYAVEVTNNGPSDALDLATGVTIADTLDSNLGFVSGANCTAVGQNVQCNYGSIPHGTAKTRSFIVSVSPSVPDGTNISNTATASAEETEIPPLTDDSDTISTLVRRRADLGISKARTSPAGNCVPGQSVSYRIEVTNAGPSDATGATVTDTFSADLTNCSWTCSATGTASCGSAAGSGNISESVDIAAGAGNFVTFNVTCDIVPGARGTLTNTASVAAEAGALPDPNSSDNTSTDNCTLAPSTDLDVTKTDSGVGLGPDPVTRGGLLVYRITVTNNGPSTALNGGGPTVTDTLPAGFTFVSASGASCSAAGPTVTCGPLGTIGVGGNTSFTITLDTSAATAGVKTNNVSAAPGAGETDPDGASASETTTVVLPNGDSCSAGAQCASGFCVDGVCCNTACNGTCQACTNALTGQPDGSCANIATAGTEDTVPADLCSSSGSGCATNGCACDAGGGNCLGTNGSSPCLNNAECLDVCISGTCSAPSGTNGPCDETADCTAGHTCSGGQCLLNDGQTCTANSECLNTCIGGVCGPTAGTGGTCDPGDNADCTNNNCDGSGVCGGNGASCTANAECVNTCISNVCSNLSGTGGTCDAGDNGDCLNNNCDASGTCGGDGAQCAADAECANGNCECADSTCSSQLCSAVPCPCGFNAAGDGTCDGDLNTNVDDPEDCAGATGCATSDCSCNGSGACLGTDGSTGCGGDPNLCITPTCSVNTCGS